MYTFSDITSKLSKKQTFKKLSRNECVQPKPVNGGDLKQPVWFFPSSSTPEMKRNSKEMQQLRSLQEKKKSSTFVLFISNKFSFCQKIFSF